MAMKKRIFASLGIFTIVCTVSIALTLSNKSKTATKDAFPPIPQESNIEIKPSESAEPIASEQPKDVKEPAATLEPTPVHTPAPESTPEQNTATPVSTESPVETAKPKTDDSSISTEAKQWGHLVSKNHATPWVSELAKNYASKYDAYYVYNTEEKVIYLTFDSGYENGYTDKILDVLKKHDAKANFFICKGFADKNPEGLKRMVNEGHIVGNHTVNHIPLYKLSAEQISNELKGVEDVYRRIIGQEMTKLMRPPEGGYSENSLKITQDLGYKTIMWSIDVPNDWNLQNQPSNETVITIAKTQHHKGAIPLLHGVSPAIANNLDEMLTIWKNEGYRFGLLTEIQ